MIARKNPSTGKWDAQYSYTDWQGKRKKTTKRGFRTKREAVEWYDHFRATQDADFNMLFKDFIEIYMEDQSHRLRQHTMMNKRFLFDKHTIAEKQTQVDEIEQTLQSVQKQVIDLDKIENISVKKALLSDKVTLPRNDFENLLNAAKQYVVYRRQDDRLQGLLDAANAKIKQLEGAIGELKQKVSKLVSKLSNIEFWHRQELDEVKSENREARRENLMLKREQKGLMNLLRRHGIDPVKEQTCEQERDER